ncbi:MAG: hypothetical protein KDA89_22150, partial [Planctomycetaceae bacterium]|nr:hypothetical protein [Planctomycetaceae bacterium]
MLSAFKRRLMNVFAADYSPVVPAQILFRDQTDDQRLRRLATRSHFRHCSWWLRSLLKAVMSLNWPLRAAVLSIRNSGKFGRDVRWLNGKGRFRQTIEQYGMATLHGVPPREYYRYELYRDENRRKAAAYLHTEEALSLFRWLNQSVGDKDVIGNKLQFADWCRAEGLPAVP